MKRLCFLSTHATVVEGLRSYGNNMAQKLKMVSCQHILDVNRHEHVNEQPQFMRTGEKHPSAHGMYSQKIIPSVTNNTFILMCIMVPSSSPLEPMAIPPKYIPPKENTRHMGKENPKG